MGFWGFLVSMIPKLKTPIQISGLVMIVVGYITARAFSPDNILAQIIAGAVGVPFLVFGQVFPYLNKFPEATRDRLIIRLFFGCIIFFVVLAMIAAYLVYLDKSSMKGIPFSIKLRNVRTIDLEHEGMPSDFLINVGGTSHAIHPSKQGTGMINLPTNAVAFAVTSVNWRGFRLTTSLNTPIAISRNGIEIEFTEDANYFDRVEPLEVKAQAKRFLNVTTDEELNQRLSLKALSEKRLRNTEFQGSRAVVRNKSGDTISPTFFDCDEFVALGNPPLSVSSANVGTVMIDRNHEIEIKDAFNAMSVSNKTLALLVAWQTNPGTKNRYRIAGFIVLRAVANEKDRVYSLTINGDSENVSIEKADKQDRIRVIP
jgi:hypothetical protein